MIVCTFKSCELIFGADVSRTDYAAIQCKEETILVSPRSGMKQETNILEQAVQGSCRFPGTEYLHQVQT